MRDEYDIGEPGHEVPCTSGDMPRGPRAPVGIIVSMSTCAERAPQQQQRRR
ncbi:hypothetical protein C7S16_6525 [Burkholderia thailandensis]|uniref:Uncharacterized protein n=1 Tax=Burkholderia thailandensis TaxID=57975 RepID=A0AAW9CK46_BURTH|nr:hypothetical protein [Burkholderia thailandensis]MDW9251365.1 hypothetical protein [Burkholderia thailandensis]